METKNSNEWYEEPEDESLEGLEANFDDYKVSTSPNDFNLTSLVNFVDKGLLQVPGFQRNYVWDLKRASKLIESLMLNLPIPQIFLYEIDSKFYVIDGQQRLMTIYYFHKGRFPKKEKRAEIRTRSLQNGGKIDPQLLSNPDLFQDFKLKLSRDEQAQLNKLHNLGYASFGEFQAQFDFKTIRTMTIKQNAPENDDSSMYEIFNRLNTGGVKLSPQEIRTSMYHSELYNELQNMNLIPEWRKLIRQQDADIHMKDVEVILRGFAMMEGRETYSPSMVSFLNRYSKNAKGMSTAQVKLLAAIFKEFVTRNVTIDMFRSNRFNVSLFDAVFCASTSIAWQRRDSSMVLRLVPESVEALKSNPDFVKLTSSDTTGKQVVKNRFAIAASTLKTKA